MDIYFQYFFLSCMVTRQQIYSVHFNYFPCTVLFSTKPFMHCAHCRSDSFAHGKLWFMIKKHML